MGDLQEEQALGYYSEGRNAAKDRPGLKADGKIDPLRRENASLRRPQ
jgi:hypothetical protein